MRSRLVSKTRLGIEFLEDRLLLADWSGDIPDGTVWPPAGEPPGTVQRIVGNVRVPAGATLTVEPGTVVKFNDFADFVIAVEGTLNADATAALPIVFTSFADDTGLDGVLGTADDQDSNGNGPSTGVAGSWEKIEFRASSTGSVLDHVDIRFGGENSVAEVIAAGELTLTDSIVRNSATVGVRIVSANPTITGTAFRNNGGPAASMDLASNPAISGVTFTGNSVNGLNVDGGTLATDATWDDPDIVYRLTSDVTVPVGRTLTIASGQIVKTTNDISLVVAGTLDANGTVAQPIIFTSDSDDSAGGDTNNNGASTGFPGDPGGIRFSPGSTGSVLDSVEVRFAGDPFIRPAQVIDNAQVTIHGGAIRSSASAGLRIINSDPLVSGMTFDNNLGAAVSMDLVSNPTITTPTLIENAVNGVALDGFASLTEDATWDNPDIVYRLVGPLTVPEGVTLTIAPGQIIKAAERVATEIFVDGTLVANGTPDAPIIFTSHLDDSAGGDTNNNGPSTGQFFDWQGIRFRATSTGNFLDHVEVRFAGANVPGAVTAQGATLTMTNSVVRGSANHAVAARSSASVVLENNVLVNSASDRGAGISSETGSIVTAVNNTIDGNFRGVSVLTSATANLRNNLITNSNSAGIFAENLATVNAVFNDVFNPGRPNYSGLTDLTGQSGNISLDPRYFNRTNLQYQLQAGSPALDAGTSDFAPATDFVGNPRFDDPNVINRGGGGMPFFDLGALERQEISVSDVDLATLNVSGPTTGMPNDVVSVNWTVRNLGAGVAIGPWSDAVYLSNDPVWSIDDRLLGRLQHNGDLGPGLSYSAMTNVTLTGLLPGRNFFIVRTNDLNQVFEGLAEGNNAAASPSSLDFALPTLTAGSPFADQFTMAGQSHFYQITVAPGQSLNVVLDSAAISGATELYIRQGGTPSRSQFDFRSVAVQPDQSLLVPTTGPGTYYILAFANFGAAANSSFTVTASIAGFDVRGVTPNSGANSGRVTIAVQGSGLTLDTQVSLVAPDNSTIPAVATQFGDASQLYATFDLTNKALGTYGVRITDDALTDTAAGIFTVVAGTPGHLVTNIVAPDRIRRGVAGSITVEYANNGGADLTAPLLLVEAENAQLRLAGSTGAFSSSLEFLGINNTGPAGVLPPGARNSIQVVFVPTSNSNITFNVSQAIASTPFNWNAAKSNLKPADVPAEAWDVIYEIFVASVGDTAGEYQSALAQDASYLSQLGEYVADTSRLLTFELLRAGNFGAVAQQYTPGALGRGLPDPTDTVAITAVDGNVTIRDNGSLRSFFIQPDSSYRGLEGDVAQLTRVGGVYRLREPDGTLTVFRADGRVDFLEDTNGNRLTYSYVDNRLTAIADSFGSQVSYAYDAQGRISQTTDVVGKVTTFAYDTAGRVVSITDAAGSVLVTYITGQGAAREHAIESIMSPDGTRRSYEYDTLGRLTRTFVGIRSEEVTFSYDGFGGVTTTDASGGSITFLRNDLGQIGLVEDSSGRITRFIYDANHRLVRTEGSAVAATTLAYDETGNPNLAVNALGERLDLSFDLSLNEPLSMRDGRGNSVLFNNDAAGNLRSITHPDGSVEQFAYDGAGNITQTTNRLGQAASYSYDAKNLLIHEGYADGSEVDYTYDAHRNLISATDSRGVTTFTYDSADRLTNVAYPEGRSLTFTYESASRRASSVDQSGFAVNYSYNPLGRLTQLSNTSGSIVTYSYDSVGRLAREDRGNGTFTEYTYFPDGKVESIVHRNAGNAILSRFDYAYDGLGRMISMTTLDGVTAYGYDAIGQLTSVSLPGGRTINYQYDAAGNRVSVTDTGVTANYATNNLNQYTTVGTTSYAYDTGGNLITKMDGGGTTSYEYDAQGRLIAVTAPSETLTYEYDFLGNRVAGTRNGQRTEYLIDPLGLGDVVAEYTGAGQLIAHYTIGEGVVSRIDADNAAGYYLFDAIGNTSQLTGPAGAVLNSYCYLPYGEILNSTGSTPNPFTYVGQYGIAAEGSGLYYMRARFYDPTVGRFFQPDPARQIAGINLYRYVQNSPVDRADPSGLITINWGWPPGSWLPLARTATGTWVAEGIEYLFAANAKEAIRASLGWVNPNGRALRQGIYETSKRLLTNPNLLRPSFASFAAPGTILTAGVETLTLGTILTYGAVAGAAGLLVGYVAQKTNFLYVNDISRTLFDYTLLKPYYFFFPGTKLGKRAEVLKRCVELGLSPGGVGCKGLLESAGITQVAPNDPNDIGGPAGFGPQHFITGEATLPYTILFENKPDAGAPAVSVVITQQLDADLDLATFELRSFGFGDRMFDVPAGRRFYSTRLDLTETIGEYVDFTAGIDLATGIATWTFTSIDPATGQQATDVDAGFLPPDQDPPEGEGFVNYTIRAHPALATGTTINAQASIRFDVEDVIDTPLYVNTIDVGNPTSTVNALSAQVSSASFLVSWSGSDDAGGPTGSGIAFFDIFVSVDGGPFTPWLEDVPAATMSATFDGEFSRRYAFYSVATDNVGHVQPTPATAQAITMTPPPFAPVQLSGQVFDDRNGNGSKDAGEGVLSGMIWTIELDLDNDGSVDRTTFTNVGLYSFSNVGQGTHRIRQVLQVGFPRTFPAGAGTHLVTPTSGVNMPNLNFGNDGRGPTLESLELVPGLKKTIAEVVVSFSERLDAGSAATSRNYTLVLAGKDKLLGTGDDVPVIVNATYVDAEQAVHLTPTTPLKLSQAFQITISGATGVTDVVGNRLDGNQDDVSGDDLVAIVGSKFSYLDSDGDRVSLSAKGTVLVLTRKPNGDGADLMLVPPVTTKTKLSGKVKPPKGAVSDGVTTLESIRGLGGVATNKLTDPPFVVPPGSISAAVVDSLLESGQLTPVTRRAELLGSPV